MNILPRISPRAPLRPVLCALFLALGIAGCSTFDDAPPVPDSTFVQVLANMHLAAARHATEVPLPDTLRRTILQRYGVSQADFDAALSYHTAHPEAYKTLYESVVDTLGAINATLRNPQLQGRGAGSSEPDPRRPQPAKVDSLEFGR